MMKGMVFSMALKKGREHLLVDLGEEPVMTIVNGLKLISNRMETLTRGP